jgi:hypothetical protein
MPSVIGDGATGHTINDPLAYSLTIDRALETPGPVFVEAIVDRFEPSRLIGREMMQVNSAMIRKVTSIAMVSAIICALSLGATAVEPPKLSDGRKPIVSGAETTADFSATLSDPEQKAQERTAMVEVKVLGVQLIDPAAVHDQPQHGQGHLHYQVDNGPVIATTTTKLSFHELSLGSHKITVMLVGNDHQPLGPRETLTINIPPANGDRAQR